MGIDSEMISSPGNCSGGFKTGLGRSGDGESYDHGLRRC